MSEQELCCSADCDNAATVRCGTWSFCTRCAVLINVTFNESGHGSGAYGTAYAFGPRKEETIAIIRESQVELKVEPAFYQPDSFTECIQA